VTALAPTLQAFFTTRLASQRHASATTVAACRDAWRLPLRHAQDRTGTQPCQLDLADPGAPFVAGFLDHLEHDRGNSVRTRNARLAAIRSFFRYAALCHPGHAGLIARVLAIPAKKAQRNELCHLSQPETDALLAAPGRDTWTGRRDHALLDVAVDTGLRVSELTGLRNRDVALSVGAHPSCAGKGRNRRSTPLRKQTAAVLAGWMKERGGGPGDPLFPTRRGTPISRGAAGPLAAKHAAVAARRCPPAARQAHHAARAPPFLRHVTAGTRRRHRGDRALARPLCG
jgi:integrase/recombinase XerD